MVYICIPAHNEAATVGVLLWKLRKVMAEFDRDYQIIVLDDASTDGTGDVLQRYMRVVPLTALRTEERIGYARAVERLLREAVARAPYPKRDVVVTLQADFTEDAADVVTLVKTLEGGADVVAGCQQANTPTAPTPVRVSRWLAKLALGGLHTRSPVSDPLSGLRGYRVIVLKKAFRDDAEQPLVRSDGWAANVELLGVVAPHARRIEEVPLEIRHDRRVRESRFRPVPALRELLRIRGSGWFPKVAAPTPTQTQTN